MLSFKRLTASQRGSQAGCQQIQDPNNILKRIVGSANEAVININGFDCKCLLDTDSPVSTVSEDLCDRLNLIVQPLNNILKLTDAGGSQLHYSGFVEASLHLTDLGDLSIESLLLAVPQPNTMTPYLFYLERMFLTLVSPILLIKICHSTLSLLPGKLH